MSFPDNPAAMTPMMPMGSGGISDELRELAEAVMQASARLSGLLPSSLEQELIVLVRNLNSCYSNGIEGYPVTLEDLEQGLRGEWAADDERRALQELAVAHVRAEADLEARLAAEPDLDVTAPEFIRWLHARLYRGLPPSHRVAKSEQGRTGIVTPGALREEEVAVGGHLPPRAVRLDTFLEEFSRSYRLDRVHGSDRLIAAAASHHRLVWIHPFLDGNGRTARLFTHAYLVRALLPGYPLWAMSRGLAGRKDEYFACLAAADVPRQGSLDGRGQLSAKGLERFCRFFLTVILEQTNSTSEIAELGFTD